ncbi:hypothetical protein DIPPA_22071 [Diplonema papillatum]|nr:hypothetical protein DIPPA_22071 [Diplonema papillatum]
MRQRDKVVSPFDLYTLRDESAWSFVRWGIGGVVLTWALHRDPVGGGEAVGVPELLQLKWLAESAAFVLCPLICAGTVERADAEREADCTLTWSFLSWLQLCLRLSSYAFLPPGDVAAVHLTATYLRPSALIRSSLEVWTLTLIGLLFISRLPFHLSHPDSSSDSELFQRFVGIGLALASSGLTAQLRKPSPPSSSGLSKSAHHALATGLFSPIFLVVGCYVSGVGVSQIFSVAHLQTLFVALLGVSALTATPARPSSLEPLVAYTLQWFFLPNTHLSQEAFWTQRDWFVVLGALLLLASRYLSWEISTLGEYEDLFDAEATPSSDASSRSANSLRLVSASKGIVHPKAMRKPVVNLTVGSEDGS